jgi:hypothetical protein
MFHFDGYLRFLISNILRTDQKPQITIKLEIRRTDQKPQITVKVEHASH